MRGGVPIAIGRSSLVTEPKELRQKGKITMRGGAVGSSLGS